MEKKEKINIEELNILINLENIYLMKNSTKETNICVIDTRKREQRNNKKYIKGVSKINQSNKRLR